MAENRQADDTDLTQTIEELRAQLEESDKSAEANRDQFLRARADLENYRKAVERDREAAIRRGKKDLFLALLDIRDNFDRALNAENDDVPESFLGGVKMIQRQLDQLLRREGIEPVESVGKPFDPALHEAVASWECAEVSADTCTDEILKGFTYQGELLRAARVRVGRPVQ